MVDRYFTLKWRHIERDSVLNHQLRESLLNGLSDANQRNHESPASLAFVRVIHRGPVNSPHKWPVTRKMFPFDDVIMIYPALIAFCIHSKASCGQMMIYWLKKSALVWLSSSWDGECQNIGIIMWNDLAFCLCRDMKSLTALLALCAGEPWRLRVDFHYKDQQCEISMPSLSLVG